MIRVFFGNRLWSFLFHQRQSQMSFSLFYSTFFFQEIISSISRKTELNSTELNYFQSPLKTTRWQVICLRDWNSFPYLVIFLLRVLLPTLNDVDVNPKKPSKPADLKMSSEVILRSPEGAGCGALRSLSRGPQSDTIPEGAGRGAVSSSGRQHARNCEAA